MANADDPLRTTSLPVEHGIPRADGSADLGQTLPPAAAVDLQATLPPAPESSGDAPEQVPPLPGYEVLAELGRGGMGVVFKARHLGLGRVVALKMILAAGYASAEERQRFRTEAEAIARLQHPNIVAVHDFGEHDGKPYLSLEFCPQGSLDRKLNGTPLPPQQAAALVALLAAAMQAAHQQNVIHRDLKPANVLLTADGTPKVTDFGLAKKLDEAGQTASGAIMGTPSYMAPEQAGGQGKAVGPAADVYSLGAILYECLTGRPPFKAATPLDTILQVVSDEPVPVRQLQPKCPRDLETICLKCLRKEPQKRYASAAELADDLGRYQVGEPITARPVGRLERAVKWVKRNPVVTGAALAVVLALVGGTTVSSLKYREAEAARFAANDALDREAKRVKERDAALEDARHQLANSSFLLAVAACDNRDVAVARQRLVSIEEKHRGWEWHYFRRQATGGIFTLYGHVAPVLSVAFSPDGSRLVTGSEDQTAKVWDARTGNSLLELKGHTEKVSSAAFSPDNLALSRGAGMGR